jgi:hypothetical protein
VLLLVLLLRRLGVSIVLDSSSVSLVRALHLYILTFIFLGAGYSSFSRLLLTVTLSLIRLYVNPLNGLGLLGVDLDLKRLLLEAALAGIFLGVLGASFLGVLAIVYSNILSSTSSSIAV